MGIGTPSNAPNSNIRILNPPRQYQNRQTNKTITGITYQKETNTTPEDISFGQNKPLRRHRNVIFRNQHRVTHFKIFNINHRQKITGQTVKRKRLRRTESSQTNTTKHIRPKEQKNFTTESLI